MIALDVLFDIVLFSVIAGGMWWVGTRPITTEEGASEEESHEQESESESAYECDHCGGGIVQEDSYVHDGMDVEIYRCGSWGRPGAIVRHSDGHTSGRGCLASQADQRIYTGQDCARALFAGIKRLSKGVYGLLKCLFGGLKRLVGWLRAPEHSHEKPCAEALRCDHEETRDRNIEECDDPSCDLIHVEQVCVDCGAHLGWRDASREELEMLLPGDRFEGPLGRVWEVDDPWLPVDSTEGVVPCILLDAHENGGEWCIECEKFGDWLEEGTFTPVTEEPAEQDPVAGRETVAADGGRPDCDDVSTVHNRLQTTFNCECVLIHDADTGHCTYYDKHTDSVDAEALDYLREQGFEILQSGRKECSSTGEDHAYIEICRDPGAVGGNGGERR